MENKKIYKVALAGNPNVGKSTVFNALTGLKQHTGNWPGKTVSNATGLFTYLESEYQLYDLPGTYSLISHSEEEEIARDFILYDKPDLTIVVCDAVCLERNLNLVFQVMELHNNVIVCVNLLDEAKKKSIYVDLDALSKTLNVPVVGTCAREKDGLDTLLQAIYKYTVLEQKMIPNIVYYQRELELSLMKIEFKLPETLSDKEKRFLAIKLLDNEEDIIREMERRKNIKLDSTVINEVTNKQKSILISKGIKDIKDNIVTTIIEKAETICHDVVTFNNQNYRNKDQRIDRILTSKWTGMPVMLLLLFFLFWLTITGANYPSEMLSNFLFSFSDNIRSFLTFLHIPTIVIQILIDGVYSVLAWVVSVMLPPMAIFFPLFTLLEDSGYLPRMAFNLDHYFKKCSACGKQALTMCMGFGCNAAGITGARIIDSPRERLIAIITNNFVPCNGRFPILIAIITMFFIGTGTGSSFLSSLLLTGVIIIGILMTFIVSKLLSATILKGIPSSFTLELPPYRKPQLGKVIVRSIFDKTLNVLGRAVIVAAPAGAVIWLMANIQIDGSSLLLLCANFLDPFARWLGMDGMILMAFILGFPANEIVIPILIMGYMSLGSMTEISDLNVLKTLFIDNGWTMVTAVCVMVFTLFHYPCSTTCLTIKKETNSIKWTLLSICLPTIVGFLMCFIINLLFS